MRRKRLETARWGAVSDRRHSAAFSRFLRDSEKTSRKSVTPREPRALGCTLSPPRMRRALLISWVACLVTTHQARLIGRCDLAKLLHQEDMDGFEGYSLSDWLCLAFVESHFNISKVNENADGSFDYGIFQINSHYWCTDHQSHSVNICHLECQGLPRARAGAGGR
ncbi:lysozyme-like protein 6 isoform X1 [Rhinolophus ferrumequinum]|uniref:lysozyme-like protein 6 isoform X1 n=2 Tax=Rhinolophus ferrumequinum TaxID=59479 RepID=UPI00140F6E04|nr:lysozyme-like protein 6 isoform X1 [Rhinolophus ferrumequinum]XP_032947582.1 lysozyme-like protein 6 isoform X1 [Rhinolophus ferrumequinum]XP_032947583.1 lysozyme-like protein 6 isoform X1 [Rhinolophus ferrumequinum]XP_032947584.1 lysozyme-like protein 6 isoform X1 [Rhinolophus ferrumequinum]XP_032947585.1 lysozyme-like protein 6 isoform X1 [Rhinolophus ferrumequinum]XP_032947586.1 lysozyme-like protein 6 isoform X1 [Rhinolophus ferrumequinum]XP_032947587.1 lysozyme-like protein 6 isoform 